MRKLLILLLLIPMCAMGKTYSTRIFDPNVRTLRTRYYNVSLGMAEEGNPERTFLVMQDGEVGAEGDRAGHLLEISFDVMSQDLRQFTYTVVHLDAKGQEDDLVSGEYLRGFSTKDITEYERSLNTSREYTHYSLVFPNEEMTLVMSGNYSLVVYEDGNPDKIILVQNFKVVDPRVKIDTKVRVNTDIEINGRYQQLDIDLTGLSGSNVANDYRISVEQNGRTDNAVFAPKPTYVDANRLRWLQCRDLIFEGGNEYRHLDIFSTFYAGTGVDRILYDRNDYHALLLATPKRNDWAYMHEFDVNGQYVVNAERTTFDDTEAEYMWVHFVLPSEQPWLDGSVFVGGEWNQNRMDYRSRMEYDNEHQCYYLTALLKQGGYDFQYWFLPKGESSASLMRTEGSNWQTENEYFIYAWYRPFGGRYDQLVGIQKATR